MHKNGRVHKHTKTANRDNTLYKNQLNNSATDEYEN